MTESIQKKHSETQTETKAETKTSKKPKLGIWLFITLTLVIALTALYMNQKLAKSITQQSKTFDATLNMLLQQQSSTEARLQAYRAVTASHEERAKVARETLEKNLTIALKEQHHVSDDWRLLKARYLLELANINAHWSTDKPSTFAMLTEADAILAPLHNPSLVTVRQALADDIQTIQSTPTTDITTLITQLNAALISTGQLPNHPLPKAENNPPTATNFLSHLITIHHTESPLTPKPTLAFEAILRASIRLSIQEAQWAVLDKNNVVYQLALKQAIHNLQQSFISHATQTKALIQQLNQLQKTSLNSEQVLPKKALKALNQIISSPDNTSNKKPGDAS
ncbi:MAG: uroporphyrinogen-III C-methyltransferase [Legionella sp.]|nr:uroporphyrinogen-III C-methyltransferase [Legionella sp.]